MSVTSGVVGNPKSVAINGVEIRGVKIGHDDVAKSYKEVDIFVISGKDLIRLVKECMSLLEVLRDMFVDLVHVHIWHE